MICRPISVQFAEDGRIALFELALQEEQVRVLRESHYKLVPAREISRADLLAHNLAAGPDEL